MSAAESPPVRKRKPSLIRRVRIWVVRQPRIVHISFLILVLGGLAFGAYYYFHTRAAQQTANRVLDQWQRFEKASQDNSESEMLAALDEIIRLTPSDSVAFTRRRALETGEADATDDYMLMLNTKRMSIAGNWQAADREAGKYLARNPNDWFARCIRAKAALLRGDRDAADKELALLPKPEDSQISAIGLLSAYEMFRMTGRSPEHLQQFLQNDVIDFLGSAPAQRYTLKYKLALFQCYLIAFERFGPIPAKLSQGWAGVMRLSATAIAEAPEAETATLVDLGLLFNQLHDKLIAMRQSGLITDDKQFRSNQDAHEERTRKVWQLVLDREPSNIQACLGMAQVHFRANQHPESMALVQRGLQSDPLNFELLELYTNLQFRADNKVDAAIKVRAAAEVKKDDPRLWLLAAESAKAAGYRGEAIYDCEMAKKFAPNSPDVLFTLAKYNIEADDWHAALQSLNIIGVPALLQSPLTTESYVLCLRQTGLSQSVPEFLDKAYETSRKTGAPNIVAAALRGVCEGGKFNPTLLAHADKIGQDAAKIWPTDPAVLAAHAYILYRMAEWGDPPWNSIAVDAALRVLDRAKGAAPGKTSVASQLIWLRLNAKRQPNLVPELAAPILAAAKNGDPLTVFDLDALGAALIVGGKLDDAVQVLETARTAHREYTGVRIRLALAYNGQGKKEEARMELESAREMTQSPQDKIDFRAALETINREKP